MHALDRRAFLESATAATAAGLSVARVSADEEKADEEKRQRVRVALMGAGGRGRQLIAAFRNFPEIEIVSLCDPDEKQISQAMKRIAGKQQRDPAVLTDFRKALDDKTVDVLVCAAPDHWHALATVWACQAGKDVYVEKPASHDIREGRKMVEAARKYGRVVQVGTQRRSGSDIQEAVKLVRRGALGDVNYARCWINSTRPNIGHVDVTKPPATLDFDLWAGPGPGDDYQTNLIPYHWHWRWAYGTGECGNNGIHALDIARWGMGMEAPTTVCCGGGKYFFDDDQQTPDTQLATFDFPDGCISWEHRTWSRRGIEDGSFGIVFYGSNGCLVTHGSGYAVYQGKKLQEKKPGTNHQAAHIRNFLDCLASREKPNADVEIGHRSTTLCHLANIAWRTRSTLSFDGETETIADNDAASELLGRSYRAGYEMPETV